MMNLSSKEYDFSEYQVVIYIYIFRGCSLREDRRNLSMFIGWGNGASREGDIKEKGQWLRRPQKNRMFGVSDGYKVGLEWDMQVCEGYLFP